MIYAVIDTNVLVSAHISKQPKSATVKVVSSMIKEKSSLSIMKKFLQNT